jgi:hypothetical protein
MGRTGSVRDQLCRRLLTDVVADEDAGASPDISRHVAADVADSDESGYPPWSASPPTPPRVIVAAVTFRLLAQSRPSRRLDPDRFCVEVMLETFESVLVPEATVLVAAVRHSFV